MFVSCPDAFVPLLLRELEALGVGEVKIRFCGAFIPQTMENVYRVNYCSRIATRVLWEIASFRCQDRQDLYNEARKIDWSAYLKLEQTFAIDANVSHPTLKNSLFAAQVLKDAICDHFKEACGARPSVDVANPDVQFNLFISAQNASISFDTSGQPLYKRGYRKESPVAPLQESIAAALLAQIAYSEREVLCDPFCGSGTILIEAAMIASHTPAGYYRQRWGFFQHPEFAKEKWLAFKQAADQRKKMLPGVILLGADSDPQAVKLSRAHLKATGFQESVAIECSDVQAYRPLSPTLLLSNPPYGKRLTADHTTYAALGRLIKLYRSSLKKAQILTADPAPARATSLRPEQRLLFRNGGLDVSLFELR